MQYLPYTSEQQLPSIIRLIENDLSEPYSIYTYRYFIHNWPQLCFLAIDDDDRQRNPDNDGIIGVVVCKLDRHRERDMRGYIAMLAVKADYRKRGIGGFSFSQPPNSKRSHFKAVAQD